MICNECSCVNWHNESCSQYEPTELEQVTAERDRLREALKMARDAFVAYQMDSEVPPTTPHMNMMDIIDSALEGGAG